MSLSYVPTALGFVPERNQNAFQKLIIENLVTVFNFLEDFCTQCGVSEAFPVVPNGATSGKVITCLVNPG